MTGTLDSGGTTAVAARVTFSAALVGAVQAIDAAQARVTVLGQTIALDGATRFNADIAPASIAGLTPGLELQVSGFRDSHGVLVARNIALRAAGEPLAVNGEVATVDDAARRLTIGALTVSYAAADITALGGRAPTSGDFLRVEGQRLDAADLLQATRLAPVDRRLPAQTGNAGHLEGWVTRFASQTDFDVDGYRVTTDGNTQFNSAQLTGFGGLRLDRFVNVVGVLQADGRLLATHIRTSNLVRISSAIASRTPYALVYSTSRCETAGTAYSIDGQSAGWSDLRAGDVATIAESFATNQPTRCHLVTVNRSVRGPVESIDVERGRMVVMGQSVHATGRTFVSDDSGARSIDLLGALRVGDVVEVSGYRSSSGQIAATRIAVATPGAANQVTGALASLDVGARRLNVGALAIDYAAATPSGFPSGGPANGQRVIVRGTLSAGLLRATTLDYEPPNPRGSTNEAAWIDGPVTALTSASDFEVEGRRILVAPGGTTNNFPPQPCSDERVELDAFVTAVTASQPVAGVDFARVRLYHAGFETDAFAGAALQTTSRVESVDGVQRTLRLGGFETAVQPLTRLRQTRTGDGGCGASLPLGELRVGDTVTVRGLPGPRGAAFVADRLDRAGGTPDGLWQVAGRLGSHSPSELLVEGLRLRLGAATGYLNCSPTEDYPDVISAAEFHNTVRRELALPGASLQIAGSVVPAGALDRLDAREVRLCVASGAQRAVLRARVESIDPAARRIGVLGIVLPLGDGLAVEDRTVTPAASGTLTQLAVGQFVELEATWRPLAPLLSAEFVAILNRSGTGTSLLKAAPDAWREPEVSVLGLTVRTDAGTTFAADGQAGTARDFFANRYASYEFEVAPATGGVLRATRVAVRGALRNAG